MVYVLKFFLGDIILPAKYILQKTYDWDFTSSRIMHEVDPKCLAYP